VQALQVQAKDRRPQPARRPVGEVAVHNLLELLRAGTSPSVSTEGE